MHEIEVQVLRRLDQLKERSTSFDRADAYLRFGADAPSTDQRGPCTRPCLSFFRLPAQIDRGGRLSLNRLGLPVGKIAACLRQFSSCFCERFFSNVWRTFGSRTVCRFWFMTTPFRSIPGGFQNKVLPYFSHVCGRIICPSKTSQFMTTSNSPRHSASVPLSLAAVMLCSKINTKHLETQVTWRRRRVIVFGLA